MARPKSETIKPTEEAKAVVAIEVDETDILKAKIAEQEKQMADLMAQMRLMMQTHTVTSVPQEKKPNRNIKFINLCNATLVLRGNRFHTIEGQFKSKQIPESEARAIISNMPNAISDGLCYIADADFVKEMELDGLYAEMLSDKQLKDLLNQNADDVCEVYRNASEAQKRIIVEMIENRKLNGIAVDANIVVKIGNLCEKDLMNITPEDEE